MQTPVKCYSHSCCIPFEVKRKTKSACVSKTSVPDFNGRPRRKKARHINADKSKPAVLRQITRKKAVVKPSKVQRVGQVVSGEALLVSNSGVKNNRTSFPKVNSPQSCKLLKSTGRNLLDASTQTIHLAPTRTIYTDPKPNHLLVTENESQFNGLLQGWWADSPRKQNNDVFFNSKISVQKRRSGDTSTGHRNSKLEVCCFPIINIDPCSFRNESDGGGRFSVGDSTASTGKGECLENEDSLVEYIYQAQDKVKHIRTRLVELCDTLKSRKAAPVSPRDTKQAKRLEKALGSIIKEVDSVSRMGKNFSSLSDVSPCRSPQSRHSKGGLNPIVKRYENCYGDTADKLLVDHTRLNSNLMNNVETPKMEYQSPRSSKHRGKCRGGPPSVDTPPSSVGKESSLTLLKKELGNFFEKMKMETDLLMEGAELHHEALLHYSDRNSISSWEMSSTDSTGL